LRSGSNIAAGVGLVVAVAASSADAATGVARLDVALTIAGACSVLSVQTVVQVRCGQPTPVQVDSAPASIQTIAGPAGRRTILITY
jgi:hypothetical protein